VTTKKLLPIIFILFLGASIFLTTILVRQRQEIRKKASVPGRPATLKLSPETGTYQVGETIPVSIFFNTANIPISAIALRLTYPYRGNSPEVIPSNILINQTLLATGDWVCPIKTFSPESETVKIDISCVNVNPAGYANSSGTLLASFNLGIQNIPAINPLVLSFDPSLSVISRKSDAQDILQTPTSTGTYTIGGPTPTPTSTSTPTPTSTLTPTPTPTPTPTTSPCGCVRVKLYDTNNNPLNLSQIKGGQTIRIFIEGTGKDQWKARVKINQGDWTETTNYVHPLGYFLDWQVPLAGGGFTLEGEINCSGAWRGDPECQLSFSAKNVGDFNNDEKIDNYDLNFLLLNWGKIEADLNQDGTTNEKDLAILLANWSP